MSRKRNDPVRNAYTRLHIAIRVSCLHALHDWFTDRGRRRATQTETPAEKQRSPRTALGGRGRYIYMCAATAHAHGRMAAGGARSGRCPRCAAVAAGRSHNHTPRCTRAHTMIVSGLCALRPRIITQPFDPGRRDARCRALVARIYAPP